MRWRFVESGPALEAKAGTIAAIDQWWAAFANRAHDLASMFSGAGPEMDVLTFMTQHLGPVDSRLMWEFAPALRSDGHRLVITPENAYELSELVSTLLAAAPALDGWEFYPLRQPESFEQVQRLVNARSGGSLDGVTVTAQPADGNLVDLRFTTASPTAQSDAFTATELLLGEAVLNGWVGAIETSKPRRFRADSTGVPVDQLPTLFSTVQDELIAGLPNQPWFEIAADSEWSVLQLQPEEGRFDGTSDIAVAVTADMELWKATHLTRFASERMSRFGEIFAYVKIDGAQGLDGSSFGDRAEIEDALNELLVPDRLGAVVGGGTGLRYSYIDLALADVDAAIPKVTALLRNGRLPSSTWLLFFDATWSSEWIGISDDSPPPP